MKSKRERKMSLYYFHSFTANAYLVWGSTSPHLIPYGAEPDRLPMSFPSEVEAQFFIAHWQHNGINAHSIREAGLVTTRTTAFDENMRTGKQLYYTEQHAKMRDKLRA